MKACLEAYRCKNNNVIPVLLSGLKVMSLNTWGMPYSLGSYDKELRMAAIGQYINQSEHDIYLLQVFNQ